MTGEWHAWLRTAVLDVTRRIDAGVAEQAPVSLDTILWYVDDGDGNFDVFGRHQDGEPITPDICGAMHDAGVQAAYDRVSVVAMSAILRHAKTGAHECRIYVCNHTGDMLVRKGAVQRNADDTIAQVFWSKDVTADTVGAGQPFLQAFWQGWEDGTAQRN